MLDVNDVKVNPSYSSVHSLVLLELKSEGRKYGKQYWKLNHSLLKDKTYISMMKQLILDVKKQYAVPVYNLDNIDYIPDELIEFQINDQLFFEVLLMEIRRKKHLMPHIKRKKRQRQKKNS